MDRIQNDLNTISVVVNKMKTTVNNLTPADNLLSLVHNTPHVAVASEAASFDARRRDARCIVNQALLQNMTSRIQHLLVLTYQLKDI